MGKAIVGTGVVLLGLLSGYIAATSGTVAVAAVVLLAGVILASTLPLTVVTAAWGMLLPIWSVGTLNPIWFDAARLVGAAILVLRYGSRFQGESSWRHGLLSVAMPLGGLAVIVFVFGLVRGDRETLTLGTTMCLSVFVALLVAWRRQCFWPVLVGFTIGSVASGLVVVADVWGLADSLVPRENAGIGRAAGLSNSSTRVAVELAAATAICFVAIRFRRLRFAAVLAAAVCLVALMLSGGRIGVAALVGVVLVGLIARWVRLAPVLLIALPATGLLWLSSRYGVAVSTLDRILNGSPAGGYSAGRVEGYEAGVDAVLTQPLFGPGLGSYIATNAGVPHMVPLHFGVVGGVILLFYTTALMIRLGWRVMRPEKDSDSVMMASHVVGATLLSSSFLEPLGPFVGVETVTLLFLCMAGAYRGSAHGASEAQYREAERKSREASRSSRGHRVGIVGRQTAFT